MRSRRLLRAGFVSLAPLLAPFVLLAENAPLSGPVSGLVFDKSSRAIRPIVGLPGAAYLGDALESDVDLAAVAPGGRSALFVRGDVLHAVLRLGEASATYSVAGEGVAGVDKIVWSADSSAAAVYNSASGKLLLWEAGSMWALGALPGRATALAVGSSGANVTVAVEGEGIGGIYLVEPSQPARLVARAETPAGLALSGANLLFTDRARGEVLLVRNYAGAGDVELAARVADPVAVAAFPGGSGFVVASAAQRKLAAFKLPSGEPLFEVPLTFEPTSLQPLSESAWLLNQGGSGPMQVLAGGAAPAVYFIPARQPEEAPSSPPSPPVQR